MLRLEKGDAPVTMHFFGTYSEVTSSRVGCVLLYADKLPSENDKHYDLSLTPHAERTVEIPKHETQAESYFPLQMIFSLKEKNGGKLNSHLWLLMGIAHQM